MKQLLLFNLNRWNTRSIYMIGLFLLFISASNMVKAQCSGGCNVTINSGNIGTYAAGFNTGGSKYCIDASGGNLTFTGQVNLQAGGTLEICGPTGNTVYFNGGFVQFGNGARTMTVNGNLIVNTLPAAAAVVDKADLTVNGNMTVNVNATATNCGVSGPTTTVNSGGTLTINNAGTATAQLYCTINVMGTLHATGSILTTSSGSNSTVITTTSTGAINVDGDAAFTGVYNNHGVWNIGGTLQISASAGSDLTNGRFYSYNLTMNGATIWANAGGCAAFIVTNFSDIISSAGSMTGNIGILDLGSPGVIDHVANPGGTSCSPGYSGPFDIAHGPYCGVVPVTAVGGGGSGCFASLPVQWLNYAAHQLDDQQIKIEWSTAQEKNNAFFTVERSEDGANFHDLGKVNGAGTSSSTNSYSYVDNFHYNGVVFYRIKQTDYDSRTTHSDIIAVSCNSHGLHFDVFPNPSSSDNHDLSFTIEGLTDNSEVVVVLMDNIGKTIYTKAFIAEKNNMLVALGDVNLNRGVYYITASSNQSIVTKKLVVE